MAKFSDLSLNECKAYILMSQLKLQPYMMRAAEVSEEYRRGRIDGSKLAVELILGHFPQFKEVIV